MEKCIVTFAPKLEDSAELKKLLDHLSEADSTFSYSQRMNFFSLEDDDGKRIFRRACWIREKLEQRGIEVYFTFLKFKVR